MIVDGIEYKKCDKCGKMCAKLEMVNWKTCKECVISELKADIEARKYAMTMSEKVEKKLRKENAELLQKVEAYDRNRDRLIAIGFPTFKSCKEYAEKLKELEAQIEKMKCCYNCSKWNDGQCANVPNDNSYYCADFICEDWEIKEK